MYENLKCSFQWLGAIVLIQGTCMSDIQAQSDSISYIQLLTIAQLQTQIHSPLQLPSYSSQTPVYFSETS